MTEKFIERATTYSLKIGELSVYETNCPCKDINFHFDQYVFSVMVNGHKTIESNNLKFEFFPGTFFIPEINSVNKVSIPNASIDNPTKCIVLTLHPSFIENYRDEILCHEMSKDIMYNNIDQMDCQFYYSNNNLLTKSLLKIHELVLKDKSTGKPIIIELIAKEMLLRLFQTEALYLLRNNCAKSIENDSIRKVTSYIANNIEKKMTSSNLATIAGMGKTTFFNKFKSETGLTLSNYILNERIKFTKIAIQSNRSSLQTIAYQNGFRSYEYFCRSFKRIVMMKPSEYKLKVLGFRKEARL
jgi:AraC-like DNA-binding protein